MFVWDVVLAQEVFIDYLVIVISRELVFVLSEFVIQAPLAIQFLVNNFRFGAHFLNVVFCCFSLSGFHLY